MFVGSIVHAGLWSSSANGLHLSYFKKLKTKKMKKESLSVMTVKTLLAVVIFAGVGTIIIGGGYIIGEYSKNKQNNKITKPINQEIENNTYYQENKSEIIDKILPEGYSRDLAHYSVEDLNNDGIKEIIIISTPIIRDEMYVIEEAYLTVITDVKKDNTYKKVGDYYFTTENNVGMIELPYVNNFIDIDNDGKKEILLSFDVTMKHIMVIFKIDWEAGKMNWLKATEYGVSYQNAFITSSRLGLETKIHYEDIDNDNMIEVIGEKKEYIYDYFEADISDLENEENYKITKFVYKWDGSGFVYDEKLSNALTPDSVNISDWQTYRNEEFEFEFSFPVAWEDYIEKPKENKISVNRDTFEKYSYQSIYFLHSQKISNKGRSGEVGFVVGIFDKENWLISEGWRKIGENDNYVFGSSPSNSAAPDDMLERYKEISSITSTFKFIEK